MSTPQTLLFMQKEIDFLTSRESEYTLQLEGMLLRGCDQSAVDSMILSILTVVSTKAELLKETEESQAPAENGVP